MSSRPTCPFHLVRKKRRSRRSCQMNAASSKHRLIKGWPRHADLPAPFRNLLRLVVFAPPAWRIPGSRLTSRNSAPASRAETRAALDFQRVRNQPFIADVASGSPCCCVEQRTSILAAICADSAHLSRIVFSGWAVGAGHWKPHNRYSAHTTEFVGDRKRES